MPTIPQLPVVTTVNAFDELPISQDGVASSVTVGLLLSGTQPTVTATSGSLLGRVSPGPGGPEPVALGAGLAMTAGVLAANGSDLAGYSPQPTLLATDQAVVVSAGAPRLLQLSALRGLFAAGANVSIDQNGLISAGSGITGGGGGGGTGIKAATINGLGHLILTLTTNAVIDAGQATGSAGAPGRSVTAATINATGQLVLTMSDGTTITTGTVAGVAGPAGPAGAQGPAGPAGPAGSGATITGLPAATTIASSDLVGISQGGADHAITYSNLLAGQTIDQVQPAVAAADTDVFWVGQGSNVLVRQTMGAVWNWVAGHLPGYKLPVVELTVNTTLDGSAHNDRLLVCSVPLTLTPAFANMGSGFFCDIINLSGGNVVFAAGITTSNGTGVLPTGQAASLRAATYSGGNLVYASIPGVAAFLTAPGAVTGLGISAPTQNSLTLAWSAPSTGGAPSSYTVQYRVAGTSAWTIASSSVTGLGFRLGGLNGSTSYDTQVFAVNAAGAGGASAIVTASTTSASAPSQVTGLAAGTPTSTAVPLSWSVPTAGGTPSAYTVQYRVTGTSAWSTASTSVTATSYTVAGLTAATGYDFQVFATNAGGAGPASGVVSATTAAAQVSSVTITPGFSWGGATTYTHGTGTISLNAATSPNPASAQIGLSLSATTPPATFSKAAVFNTNYWGAYVATPAVAGSYFIWVQALNAGGTQIGQLVSATATVQVV